MTSAAEMLAFGQFETHEQATLDEAAHASAIDLYSTSSAQEAMQWLEQHEASAILLAQGQDGENLALNTRAQGRHRALPILSLAHEPSDLIFVGAYSWGADDVVSPDSSWPLARRLRALTQASSGQQPAPRGTAVVGELDQYRRVATARALFNVGYDVRFALTEEDLQAFSLEPKVSLVVLSTELCGCAAALIDETRSNGSIAQFIVSAEPRKHNELSKQLFRKNDVRLTDSSAPPENVVFLANELAAGTLPDKRASPRILHGTTVRFRGEGRERDELGFSYNVSEGGMYVRTLAPPIDDVVWLELTPPKSSKRVRLVGEVAWRRPFGPSGRATVPPGFGLKLIDASHSCRLRWQEGCSAAASELYLLSEHP